MALKISDLSKAMFSVMKESFSDSWPDIRDYAASETKKLAQGIVDIEKMLLKGTIDKDTAKALFEMNKNSMKMVLIAIEGVGIIAVEKAINEALKVIKDSVNTALGFKLF